MAVASRLSPSLLVAMFFLLHTKLAPRIHLSTLCWLAARSAQQPRRPAGRLRLAGPLFCPPSAGRPRVHHARRAKQGRPESYAWQVKPVCVHASKRTKYWCNLLPFSRRAALERGHQQFARGFCCFNVGPLKRQAFWLAGWQPALFMLCSSRDGEISPQRLARNPSSVAPVCV